MFRFTKKPSSGSHNQYLAKITGLVQCRYRLWCGFDRASSLICGNRMPTRCNRWIFIADRIACSACFGHHYAHHRELESFIQLVGACELWCLVFKLSVENQAPKTTGDNQLYNTLELLMMGIKVPETCWASNKICNKKNSSVASSWHFISTYYRRCTVKSTSNL
jgi:hypothetical protein